MPKTTYDTLAGIFPWQGLQWSRLSSQIELNQLPHAISLVGPSDLGKERFSLTLAQRVLCVAPLGGHSCGHCKSCSLFLAGNHPDLIQLQPDSRGKAIRVDSIRDLNTFFGQTSQQGGWKVVIINPAESLNNNAANALLKNLEEPRKKTLIVLVSHDPGRLMATIKSRCQVVKFPVPLHAEVQLWLSKKYPDRDDIDELIQYANGRPLMASKLVGSDLLVTRRKFDDLLDSLAAGSISPIIAAEICKGIDSRMALDWLYYKLVSEIKSGIKITYPVLSFRYMDKLAQSRILATSPANLNLLLIWEELLINWKQIFITNKSKPPQKPNPNI